MTQFGYFYHGFHVRSTIDIPEWAHFEEKPAESPDILISVKPGATSVDTELQQGEFRFCAQDIAWFQVVGGSEIVITPAPGAHMRGVRLYATGSAWAALLYQRGIVVLHASAVLTEHGAALFCGPRGSGKSTLAASLSGSGFPLIGDDMCRLEVSGSERPRVYPSAPRLKLWEDAVHQLGWETLPSQTGFRLPKLHYSRLPPASPESIPICALYLADWGDFRISRLRGTAALQRLMERATWRSDLLVAAGDPGEHVLKCAEILARTPAWEFRRPRELTEINASISILMEQLKLSLPE